MLRPRWQPADSSCCLELFFGSCLNESSCLAQGACPPTDRMVLSCCTRLGCCCAGVLCSTGWVLLRGRGLQQGLSPLREGWEVVPW